LDGALDFSYPADGTSVDIIFNKINGRISDETYKKVYVLLNPGTAVRAVNVSPFGVITLNDGEVGWWKMDEGLGTIIGDGSGYGNGGTMSGGVTWVIDENNCKEGKCADFDGSSGQISLGNPPQLTSSVQGLTIAAWVKYDAWGVAGSSRPYVSDWNSWAPGSQKGFLLRTYQAEQRPEFDICDGVNYSQINSSQALTLGVWYHVVGVFVPNQRFEIYVNGVKKGSGTAPATYIPETATPVYIGRGGINSGRFDGMIDDVRIYDHGLSSDEVKHLYELTK
jgi:hypothetical protein